MHQQDGYRRRRDAGDARGLPDGGRPHLRQLLAHFIGKSGDAGCPKPNSETKRLSRSVPTRNPILIAPMLLDCTITSLNESTP